MSPLWRIIGGLGLVLIFTLIFGIFLDGFATLLAWTSGGSTIADFTGLEQFMKFGPFILWILGFGAGIFLGVSGIKELMNGNKTAHTSSGGMH